MYNTVNPVPSAALEDMADNAQTFDALVTKTEGTTTDRLGRTRRVFQQILMDMGFKPLAGSFQTGATITARNQALYDEVSHVFYSWGGIIPVGGYIVPAGSTPTPLGAGAWVDRTDLMLRNELGGATGSTIVNHGAGSIGDIFDAARPLSYYGADSAALLALLNYAKTTQLPVRLTSDVAVPTLIDIDFLGAKLVIDFAGYSLLSDSECLVLKNLSLHSEIHNPSLKNVTAPWCITRWSGDSWIKGASTILATLTQTNDIGYYQPSVNDQDIWSSLPADVQNQNIAAKMRIVGSTDVKMYTPRGRFCLYEFDMCHRCEVFNPDIASGGKGVFGTILFKNIGDTSYGVGNKVHGGRVGYGTFSSVGFMRNKKGGVDGGFVPYRCGESGVKTFQNEVGGRSARCYNMEFSDIFPYQAVYDGVDFLSDFGTATERVDDYSLAQYPWHELPTAHKVTNVQSLGCNSTGIWGDGQFNRYSYSIADGCRNRGINLLVKNSLVSGMSANECNTTNASGAHQITVVGEGNRVVSPSVTTSSAITTGYAVYLEGAGSTLIDEFVVGARTAVIAPNRGAKRVDSLRVGSNDITASTVEIDLHPRGDALTNGAAMLRGVVTAAASGAEFGNAELRGRNSGNLVKGVRAIGSLGGFGTLGLANTVNHTLLENGELYLYQNGTSVVLAAKLADGTVKTATIIA